MDAAQHRESPYQGLNPYTEDDADFFFGRENDTRLIVANLFSSRLTLLYGESGVGKSSVLRAGVVRHIGARRDIVAVRFVDWEENSLEGLKLAVAEALSPRLSGAAAASGVPPPDPGDPLPEFLGRWAELVGCRVAVLLDQFEDYFQYNPKDSDFALELSTAIMQSEAPVSFLISIREDAYASLDRFEGVLPIIFDNNLRLDRLDHGAAQATIEEPVKRYNELCVTDGRPYSVDPGLVEAVLEQVKVGALGLGPARGSQKKREPQVYQLDTVYLQLVMKRLWQEEAREGSRVLRYGTLDRLGGAKKIVRTHLAEVMHGLVPDEKRVAAMVFRYLVTPTGTKVAYPVDELAMYERVDKEQLGAVLKKLSEGERRILRQVAPVPGMWPEPRYEIFHDALGDAILDWGIIYIREREQEEVKRELEAKREQEEIRREIEAKREQALKELEQKKLQVRLLLSALVISLLIALLLIVVAKYAIGCSEAAERARTEAEAQKADAARQRAQLGRELQIVNQQDLAVKYIKKVIRGHEGAVTDAAFSPDNKWIVTGGEDDTAMLWDVNTGALAVGVMKGHSGPIHKVAISPDWGRVATAGGEKSGCPELT